MYICSFFDCSNVLLSVRLKTCFRMCYNAFSERYFLISISKSLRPGQSCVFDDELAVKVFKVSGRLCL